MEAQQNRNLSEDLFYRKQIVLIGCISIFTTAIIVSSITASKIYSIQIPFLNMNAVIPVGTSLFALTFFATDVITEVWGRRYSFLVVAFGAICRLIALGFLTFAVWVEPVSYWPNQEAYATILGTEGSTRIIIAGLCSYLVSETWDVFIFHHMKSRSVGKNALYIRNLTSTLTAQVLDSTIFVLIAFAATVEPSVILTIILGQLAIKAVIAVFDTPLVYLLRNIALGRRWYDWRG